MRPGLRTVRVKVCCRRLSCCCVGESDKDAGDGGRRVHVLMAASLRRTSTSLLRTASPAVHSRVLALSSSQSVIHCLRPASHVNVRPLSTVEYILTSLDNIFFKNCITCLEGAPIGSPLGTPLLLKTSTHARVAGN